MIFTLGTNVVMLNQGIKPRYIDFEGKHSLYQLRYMEGAIYCLK